MRKLLSIIFSINTIVISNCALAAQIQAEKNDAKDEIYITSSEIEIARIALMNLKKYRKQWKCFKAEISNTGHEYQVSFVPMDNVVDKGDYFIVGNSKCGTGVTYIINENGKLLKTIHSR